MSKRSAQRARWKNHSGAILTATSDVDKLDIAKKVVARIPEEQLPKITRETISKVTKQFGGGFMRGIALQGIRMAIQQRVRDGETMDAIVADYHRQDSTNTLLADLGISDEELRTK